MNKYKTDQNKNIKKGNKEIQTKKENNAEKEKPINKNDINKEKKYINKRNWNDYLEKEKIADRDINIKMKKSAKENN